MERNTETQASGIPIRRELPRRLATAALCAAATAFATDTGVSPLAPALACGLGLAGIYPVWALCGAALGSLIFLRWRSVLMLTLFALTQLGWGVVRDEPKRRDKLLLMALAGVITLPVFGFASLDALFLGIADVGLTLTFAVSVRLTAGAVSALGRGRPVDEWRQAGVCLSAAMAVAALARIELIDISPAAILAAAAAMYAVQLRGAAGVSAAVALGIARVFGGGSSMLFTACMAACALGAAALRGVGKWGVAAGFVATGIVISLYAAARGVYPGGRAKP